MAQGQAGRSAHREEAILECTAMTVGSSTSSLLSCPPNSKLDIALHSLISICRGKRAWEELRPTGL